MHSIFESVLDLLVTPALESRGNKVIIACLQNVLLKVSTASSGTSCTKMYITITLRKRYLEGWPKNDTLLVLSFLSC